MMLRNLLIFLVILIFTASSVFGFGLAYSGGGLGLVYRPNTVAELKFYVVSNSEQYARMDVGGELEKYAVYDKVIATTSSLTPVVVKFVFPSKREKPGLYEHSIHVTQAKPQGEGQITYLVGAMAPFQIRVLDPEKYIELGSFSIDPKHTKLGEKTTFIINGINHGEQDVTKAKGVFSIFYNDKLVDALSSEEKPVKSEQSIELTATWETKKRKPGEYKAIAKIVYDSKETAAKEAVFYIGDEQIVVQNYTKYLTNDSINRFSLIALSQWNVPIDFSAGLSFIQDKKEIVSFKTPTYILEPWVQTTFDSFVDTRGFTLGRYDLNISIFANNKLIDVHKGEVEIIEGKPNIVIQQVEKEVPAFPTQLLTGLIVLIAVLVIINIIFLVIYARKKKA